MPEFQSVQTASADLVEERRRLHRSNARFHNNGISGPESAQLLPVGISDMLSQWFRECNYLLQD